MKRVLICVLLGALTLIADKMAQAQSTYSNAVMSLGPVAYWPLGETTVPNPAGMYVATNSVTAGAGCNGYYETWWTNFNGGFSLTNVNDTVHGSGIIAGNSDTAMQCGGTGQYAVVPRTTNGVANPAVTMQGSFSVEMWVYIHSTNGIRELFTEGGNFIEDPAFTNAISQEGVEVGFNVNHFYFKTYNGPGGVSGGTSLAGPVNPNSFSNSWHHLVLTYNASSSTKIIYDNGIQVVSAALTVPNALGQVFQPDYVSPLVIGNGNELGGGSSTVFDGKIGEFAVYPTALSAGAVANHYAAGTNPAPATSYVNTVLGDSPAIYLRLNEPAFVGPSLASLPVASNYGSLGSSANGLYQPGTAPGSSGPAYGGFSSPSYAVALNGFNGGVDVGGGALPPALNPTNNQPFTVMTWFRGNPADAGPRLQELAGHGNNGYRLGVYTNVSGSVANAASVAFNPGAGPLLNYTNMAAMSSAGMDLNDGNWHLAVGVSDGANDYLYLDGILALNKTSVAAITGDVQDLILGGDPSVLGPLPSTIAGSRGGLFYDGSIAQAAFFTNALTAAQIQQLFSAADVPPIIHAQPAPTSLSLPSGTNAVFASATVSGSSTIRYQWYSTNGAAVSAQTNSSLTISNILTGNSGSYYFVATNLYGAATSSVVSLTVYGPPVITQSSPTNIEVFGGSSPILNLTALGSLPFTYQWRSNGVSISSGTNYGYAVSTSSNNLITVTYIGMVSNAFGAAFVTNVVTSLADPTAAYPLAVLADGPMAYFRLNESSGTTAYDYVGGNNAIYTNVDLGQPGYSALEPSETSAEFGDYLPNNDYAGNVPSYLTFATNSGNGEFSVEAWVTQYAASGGSNGIVTLGYGGANQFVLDGGASTGGDLRFGVRNAADASFIASSAVSIANDGRWHHIVGVCDEAGGHLYLYLDGVQIASTTITSGSGILPSTVPLSIGARESGNNNPVSYDEQFSGAIDDVAIYNQALSSVQVQNHFFASGAEPIISQIQPSSSLNVNQGDNATFTVSASGSAPLSYQWYDNNNNSISWATNSTITVTNVQSSQAGSYKVVVTNPYGSPSTNASLTVNTGAPTIAVDIQPTNVICNTGTFATYSVTVLGSDPFVYQWYQDNLPVSGATNLSYSFTALGGTNTYWVAVTNSYGSTNSSTATVVGVAATLINPSNYTSSLKITFNGYNRAGAVTNFPVLVRLSTNLAGFSYAQFASPIGADLSFTAASNTQALPYEIERWNPAGESIVWVQVPLISGTNSYINAYWGNPAQTNAAASNTNGAVWTGAFSATPDYDLVWHLDQTNFPFLDSTLQDPATNGVAGVSAAGLAGLGLGFDGATTYLDAGVLNLSNSFTLSVWVNISPSNPNIQTIWASKPGSGTANGFAMNVNDYNTTDGALRFISGNGSSTGPVTSPAGSVTFGQWHLVTAAVNTTANTAHVYVDGTDVTLGTTSILSNFSKTNDVFLGVALDYFYHFDGTMDEARISNVLRSPDWIWASWATSSTNAAFTTYAPVTTVIVSPVVITSSIADGNELLNWSQGTLQSANQVGGPYADIVGAVAPYAVLFTNAQQFYRVRVSQ